MQAVSTGESRVDPRLGIVLLDLPHLKGDFGAFAPNDPIGLGTLPTGWFEAPSTWPFSTVYACAAGATAEATLAAEPASVSAVAAAVGRLSDSADLIIGDCGFFWAASETAHRATTTPLLLSALNLLDFAAATTRKDIGVLTFSAQDLERLFSDHPLRGRLRIIGVSNQPNWAALRKDDYGLRRSWSHRALGVELLEVLIAALPDGSLADIGCLVLECTVMPQFRGVLRRATALPIFDVASTARALLNGLATVQGPRSAAERSAHAENT